MSVPRIQAITAAEARIENLLARLDIELVETNKTEAITIAPPVGQRLAGTVQMMIEDVTRVAACENPRWWQGRNVREVTRNRRIALAQTRVRFVVDPQTSQVYVGYFRFAPAPEGSREATSPRLTLAAGWKPGRLPLEKWLGEGIIPDPQSPGRTLPVSEVELHITIDGMGGWFTQRFQGHGEVWLPCALIAPREGDKHAAKKGYRAVPLNMASPALIQRLNGQIEEMKEKGLQPPFIPLPPLEHNLLSSTHVLHFRPVTQQGKATLPFWKHPKATERWVKAYRAYTKAQEKGDQAAMSRAKKDMSKDEPFELYGYLNGVPLSIAKDSRVPTKPEGGWPMGVFLARQRENSIELTFCGWLGEVPPTHVDWAQSPIDGFDVLGLPPETLDPGRAILKAARHEYIQALHGHENVFLGKAHTLGLVTEGMSLEARETALKKLLRDATSAANEALNGVIDRIVETCLKAEADQPTIKSLVDKVVDTNIEALADQTEGECELATWMETRIGRKFDWDIPVLRLARQRLIMALAKREHGIKVLMDKKDRRERDKARERKQREAEAKAEQAAASSDETSGSDEPANGTESEPNGSSGTWTAEMDEATLLEACKANGIPANGRWKPATMAKKLNEAGVNPPA